MSNEEEIRAAKHRERQKRYYNENKAKIAARRKGKQSDDAKRARDMGYYDRHKEERKIKMMARYWRQKKLVDDIALHYGCQNPNCKWQGELKACQLDFHHVDRKTKTKEIGKLYGLKLSRIALEINKCVVLCKCCHALQHSGEGLNLKSICNVDEKLSPR